MPVAPFHITILQSSTKKVLYSDVCTYKQFKVGQSSDCFVVIDDLPDLLFRQSALGLEIVSEGNAKAVGIPSKLTLSNGWVLEVGRKDDAQGTYQLTFVGELDSAPKVRQESVFGKLFLRALIAIFALSLLTSPWWLSNFDNDQKQSVVETALENTLSPGPLHAAHQSSTKQCSDCHQGTFESIPIEPCLECHTMKRHLTREQTGVHPLCVTCHKEHEEPSLLINLDSRLCTQCHANHATVEAVAAEGVKIELDVISGFPDSHPPFSTDKQSLVSIRFNHEKHMKSEQVIDANSGAALACVSCHVPDKDESGFLPVTMQNQCSSCHSLVHKPEKGAITKIEHGDLFWITRHLNGSNSEQGNNFEEVSRVMASQCSGCHVLPEAKFQTLEAVQAWAKEQKINVPAFKKVQFSHARHQTNLECESCHISAAMSENSVDNLLPNVKECSSCHQSSPDDESHIKTECADCHVFHTVPWD